MIRDLSGLQSIAAAPSIPISSSTVNTHSSGGCGISSASSIASANATAIPSSPPRVVPSADITPSSNTSLSPSCSKSISQSVSFSHTISICPCSITDALFSYPAVPSLNIITLLLPSCINLRFLSVANFTR